METQLAVIEVPPSQIIILPTFPGTEETADALQKRFEPFHTEAISWILAASKIQITDAAQVSEMKLARATRLGLRQVRLKLEKAHEAEKAGVLSLGRSIDWFRNAILAEIEPAETHLLEQEKFAERLEASRKEALKLERAAALEPFGVDASFFNLAEMPEEQFAELRCQVEISHVAKLAKIRKDTEEREAAQIAEARERREQAEELAQRRAQALIDAEALKEERRLAQAELDRLADELRERELAALKEREERETKEREAQQERDKLAAKERQRLDDAAAEAERGHQRQREADQARADLAAEELRVRNEAAAERASVLREAAETTAREEREARQALEAKQRKADELAAEQKRKQAAAEKRAKAAPDREKLTALAATVRALPMPVFSTADGLRAGSEIAGKIEALALFIEAKGGAL